LRVTLHFGQAQRSKPEATESGMRKIRLSSALARSARVTAAAIAQRAAQRSRSSDCARPCRLRGDASQVADEFDADLDLTKLMQDVPAIEDLLESADDAPVIRMINALLTQSLREGASYIHIEPSSSKPRWCVSD